jgi:hypothetical protein
VKALEPGRLHGEEAERQHLFGVLVVQVLAFGALTRSAAPWPSSVQRPLPADQLSVPAKQGLRADQEGPPGRARKDAAEGAEQQAVGGLEARSMDLAFEDTELVTEGENLDLERGLALPAEAEQIDQEADDGVREAEDHEVGS